ncbi:ROK family glucokinase [Longirhabdus pacifica]|uniref:ROK family glucokinase n=1 Tax=Longirhabdus pacifica TaxID=2305227 RepID=UPI00100914E0|nr:ROK family glucokinase [Longirhabdus pacifica]
MSDNIYIGVDLGGTTIKVGLCNEDGKLLHKYEGPTEANQGPDKIIDNIYTYVHHIVEQSPFDWEQVAGVGTGVAGFLDMENGIVKLAPNLGLTQYAMREKLEQKLNKKVVINNDANVAALGEVWAGAGRQFKNVVCFTLGTGVGGGIIIDGKIYEGNGMAGELGHITIVPEVEAITCGCGKYGCLETVSSATGIINMANDALERGSRTTLSRIEGDITAKDVFDAAKTNDEVAVRIVHRAASYLAKSMAIVATVLNPQLFVIGGGVSAAGDILFDALKEEFAACALPQLQENVDIVPAQLGNNAGIIGAAGLLIHGK